MDKILVKIFTRNQSSFFVNVKKTYTEILTKKNGDLIDIFKNKYLLDYCDLLPTYNHFKGYIIKIIYGKIIEIKNNGNIIVEFNEPYFSKYDRCFFGKHIVKDRGQFFIINNSDFKRTELKLYKQKTTEIKIGKIYEAIYSTVLENE